MQAAMLRPNLLCFEHNAMIHARWSLLSAGVRAHDSVCARKHTIKEKIVCKLISLQNVQTVGQHHAYKTMTYKINMTLSCIVLS